MPVSPFDSKLFAALFSDPDMAALFSDEAAIAAMLKVEVALAKVQAEIGLSVEAVKTEHRNGWTSYQCYDNILRIGIHSDIQLSLLLAEIVIGLLSGHKGILQYPSIVSCHVGEIPYLQATNYLLS